jgi:hypothetical protein
MPRLVFNGANDFVTKFAFEELRSKRWPGPRCAGSHGAHRPLKNRGRGDCSPPSSPSDVPRTHPSQAGLQPVNAPTLRFHQIKIPKILEKPRIIAQFRLCWILYGIPVETTKGNHSSCGEDGSGTRSSKACTSTTTCSCQRRSKKSCCDDRKTALKFEGQGQGQKVIPDPEASIRSSTKPDEDTRETRDVQTPVVEWSSGQTACGPLQVHPAALL